MTTAEKVCTDMMSTFIQFQKESEEQMMKCEERRAEEDRAREE